MANRNFFDNRAPRESRQSTRGTRGTRRSNDDLTAQLAALKAQRERAAARRGAETALNEIDLQQTKRDRINEIALEQQETLVPPEESKGWLSRVGDVLDLPAKHVARPLMGSILAGVYAALPGEQGGEQALKDAFTFMPIGPGSEKRRQKMRDALKETSLPTGLYTVMEIGLDPTTWFGAGFLTAPLKRGAVALVKGQGKQQLAGSLAKKGTGSIGTGITPPLMEISEVVDVMASGTVLAKLGERLSHVPVIGAIVGKINPSSAVMRGDEISQEIGRTGIAHMQLLDHGENLANVAVATTLKRVNHVPFSIKNGKTFLTDGKEYDIQFVMENWQRLAGRVGGRKKTKLGTSSSRSGKLLTDAQITFLEDYQSVVNQAFQMAKDEGISIGEIFMKEGRVFIPRVVVGKDGISSIGSVTFAGGKKVGSKPSSFKERYYATIEEGIENGIDYLNDPLASLLQYVKGIYRVSADKKYLDAIRPLGRSLAKGDAKLAFRRTLVKRYNAPLEKMLLTIGKALDAKTKLRVASFAKEVAVIKRSNPELAARLRSVLNARNSLETQQQGLMALKREVTDTLTKTRVVLKEAEDAFQASRFNKGLDEMLVKQPGFAGTVFPREVAKAIDDRFRASSLQWMNGIQSVNDSARFMATAFDMGGGFIQGLPLLLINPIAWVRTQARSMRAFADPDFLQRFKAHHENTFKEMAQYSVPVSRAEQIEAGMPGGAIDKLLRKLGPAGRPLRSLTVRAGTAFNMVGDSARSEFWEAMKPMVLRKHGVKFTLDRKSGIIRYADDADPRAVRQALTDLGGFVSKATGALPNSKLGINATQAQVERSLMFASRYFRATVGLTADAFQGGVTGDIARRSLGKMLASGMMMHYATALGMGQEPKLDPTKGDFLTVEVNGQRVGVGSAWISLARFVGKVYDQIAEERPGNDDKLLSFDPQQSILAQFARYRASPIVGFGWDVAVGRDPIGEPVANPIEQPLQFFHPLKGEIAPRFVPIWAQQLLPDYDVGEFEPAAEAPFTSIPAEFAGLRTFPTSVFTERRDLREQLALDSFDRPWEQLGALERNRIEAQSDELVRLNRNIRAFGLERGDDLDVMTAQYLAEKGAFREEYVTVIQQAEDAVIAGAGTAIDFIDRVQAAGIELRGKYNALDHPDGPFTVVIARLKEIREAGSGDDPLPIEDIAYDEFFIRIILATDEVRPDEFGTDQTFSLHDKFGIYDFEERRKREDSIIARYGEDVFLRVAARLESGRDPLGLNVVQPQMLIELNEGRQVFEAYWDIGNTLAEKAGIKDVWQAYNRVKASARGDLIVEENKLLASIDDQVTDIREAMRDASPALEGFLLKFGYIQTPRNKTIMRWPGGKLAIQDPKFDLGQLTL